MMHRFNSLFIVLVIVLVLLANDASSINIKLVTFHKNNPLMLLFWVRYHGALFGYDNIHVIDNDSNNQTLLTLRKMKRMGATHSVYKKTYYNKWIAVTNYLKQHNTTGNLLIPLDVDEFIVATLPGGGFSTNRDLIRDRFKHLPADRQKYKFSTIDGIEVELTSNVKRVINRVTHFRLADSVCHDKVFFAGGSFISTDQGNHFGKMINDSEFCMKDLFNVQASECSQCYGFNVGLGLLHYGSTALTFQESKIKCENQLIAYNIDVETINEEICSRLAQRYCKFLLDIKKMGERNASMAWRDYQLSMKTFESVEMRELSKLYSW